ncbi:unnamed protein product, partial [Larinioides sclopetarius]
MTRKIPEAAIRSAEELLIHDGRINVFQAGIHGGSSMKSGFELDAFVTQAKTISSLR